MLAILFNTLAQADSSIVARQFDPPVRFQVFSVEALLVLLPYIAIIVYLLLLATRAANALKNIATSQREIVQTLQNISNAVQRDMKHP